MFFYMLRVCHTFQALNVTLLSLDIQENPTNNSAPPNNHLTSSTSGSQFGLVTSDEYSVGRNEDNSKETVQIPVSSDGTNIGVRFNLALNVQ